MSKFQLSYCPTSPQQHSQRLLYNTCNMQPFHSKQASLFVCLEMQFTVYTLLLSQGKEKKKDLVLFYQGFSKENQKRTLLETHMCNTTNLSVHRDGIF